MSIPSIRREVEKALGQPIPKNVWGYLVKNNYISDVERGYGTIEEVADQARDLMKLAGPQLSEPLRGPSGFLAEVPKPLVLDRRITMSKLVASEASRDESVRVFRGEFLPTGLLRLERVAAWVERQSKKDGPATVCVSVPVESSAFEIQDGRIVIDPPLKVTETSGLRRETLSYVRHDSQWTHAVSVRAGGVLDRLAELSRLLARRYTWQEAQATTFILTGLTPMLNSVSTDISRKSPHATLTRITITADPTVPPNEISEAFRRARAEVLSKRPRVLSERHLKLVLFCDARPDQETWAERMAGWNREHPNWRYEEPKNFLRDANQGLRRLLGKSFKFSTSRGTDE